MCRETGAEFLSALTDFVNLVLAGRWPSDVAPVFFGGRLLVLNKKTGGICPIAIGFTLRRLASKCANAFGTFGINKLTSLADRTNGRAIATLLRLSVVRL